MPKFEATVQLEADSPEDALSTLNGVAGVFNVYGVDELEDDDLQEDDDDEE